MKISPKERRTRPGLLPARANAEWHAGFACALAQVARMGHDAITEAVMTGSGLSLSHLKAHGVETYDLAPIRRALRKQSAPTQAKRE